MIETGRYREELDLELPLEMAKEDLAKDKMKVEVWHASFLKHSSSMFNAQSASIFAIIATKTAEERALSGALVELHKLVAQLDLSRGVELRAKEVCIVCCLFVCFEVDDKTK